jgi:hypothetical protein
MARLSPLRVQDIDLADFEIFVQGKAHDAWRLLRAEAPVHWNAGNDVFPGFWSVTKYADVIFVRGYDDVQFATRILMMRIRPSTPASGAGRCSSRLIHRNTCGCGAGQQGLHATDGRALSCACARSRTTSWTGRAAWWVRLRDGHHSAAPTRRSAR